MFKSARFPLGFFLVAHGIAHLMATSVYWKLNQSKDLPYSTSILAGQLDLGSSGIWLFGLVWLLAGAATAAAGVALMAQNAQSKSLLLAATLFSLVLCTLVYDRAQIGLVIDLAVLLGLFVASRLTVHPAPLVESH